MATTQAYHKFQSGIENGKKPIRMQTVVRKYNKENPPEKRKPDPIITLGEWSKSDCKHMRTEATPVKKGGYIIETCIICKATRNMPGIMSLINEMFAQGTLKARHHRQPNELEATIHIQKPTRGKLDHSGFKGR
jgi:hypothetical protein